MVVTFIILSSLVNSAAAKADAKCLSLRCPKVISLVTGRLRLYSCFLRKASSPTI